MKTKIFGAIDVGSYELGLKIFEFSQNKGMRQIDHLRYPLDLGTDTFQTGKLPAEKVDELSRILRQFNEVMKSYKVEDYVAYGTSAIRETKNTMILLDQIQQRTGIKIDVLSNSEQRFLDYKSVASKGETFDKLLEGSTAILDFGGGSLQISLFEQATLITTQNLRLGVLKLQDMLRSMNLKRTEYEAVLVEIMDAQLKVFQKLYLKGKEIDNIILIDDHISSVIAKRNNSANNSNIRANDVVDIEYVRQNMSEFSQKSITELSAMYDTPKESVTLLYISVVMLNRCVSLMNAKTVWIPGVTLCDGIAYEYAEKNKLLKPSHDFEKDIVASAINISKRYSGSMKRSSTLEKIAVAIFDSTTQIHGLDKRDRLLLQLATMLHDCGKYISLNNLGPCSYNIIMSTEIIGISHIEREIVANVVKYNHMDFDYYETMILENLIDEATYLRIAKLTAILKLANGLDRSHKQKFKDVKVTRKDNELILKVDTSSDITLERGMFGERAQFFEEVFSLKPVIVKK